MEERGDTQPTRWEALLFGFKAWVFRASRMVRNLSPGAPQPLPQEPVGNSDIPAIAESRTPLYGSTLPAEFALQAGKVQNLRVAARALHGRILRAGQAFSFWAHIPRPTRWRRFAPGRELREGCVIPSIGGGLCQLTNALYDAALGAGCEIVERHAHSRRLPGSMAQAGRDATVFWNYVDLRFRAPVDCRLEVEMSRRDLVVRFRPLAPGSVTHRLKRTDCHEPVSSSPQNSHSLVDPNEVESCETCGVTSCFRNPAAVGLSQSAVTAWLVDAWWPEYGVYIDRARGEWDWLFTPLDSRRFRFGRYFWKTDNFHRVRQAPWFTLWRSILSRRLAAQGAMRQRALLRMDARLARRYGERLPYAALHVVVSQNLLPFLWMDGHLAGRTFDVLMTRLPMRQLQARLDHATEHWPNTRTLGDFRADPALVAAETAALAQARRWITPHSDIAAGAGERALKLDWELPKPRPTRARKGARLIFPSTTLGRKGAYELRTAARATGWPISLLGPVLESPDFWEGCDVRRRTEDDWLDDAAAVVLPAWVEHQPRRLLAAIAAGLPVIATKACGLDGLPGVTIIENGDIAALTRAGDEALSEGRHKPTVSSQSQPGRSRPF